MNIMNLKSILRRIERKAVKRKSVVYLGVNFADVMIKALKEVTKIKEHEDKECPKDVLINEIIKQLEFYINHRYKFKTE